MSARHMKRTVARRRSLGVACAGALAAAVALPAGAAGASAPRIATGTAQHVSYATATLTGAIDPEGQDTSYFFQYGTTKAYGSQTALADAGAGFLTVRVRLPVGGLQPLTRYHFRLIAVNATGATTGHDSVFMTTKVPLSLAILVAPNPVIFGGNVLVVGTLSGTSNGAVPVVLQANPFPYLQGFSVVGNPELTTASGGFSFPVFGLQQVTQFRVVTISGHKVVSPVAVAYVAVRVDSHVGRTSRPHFARIYGTVVPAEDGAEVGILRIAHGHGVVVGGTHLRHRNASSSSFIRVVPVHSGAYRVLVRVTTGAQVSNYGRPLLIR
jgi:hypothetical protein